MVIVYLGNFVPITLADLKLFPEKVVFNLRGCLHKSVNTVVISYVCSPYVMLPSPLCGKKNMGAFYLVKKGNLKSVFHC